MEEGVEFVGGLLDIEAAVSGSGSEVGSSELEEMHDELDSFIDDSESIQ